MREFSKKQLALFFILVLVLTVLAAYLLFFELVFCGQDYSTLTSRCETLSYWINN